MGARRGNRELGEQVTDVGAAPSAAARLSVDRLLPDRFAGLLDRMRPDGSRVLLMGEAGSGKSRLAEAAATALDREFGPGSVIRLPPPRGRGLEEAPTLATAFAGALGVHWEEPAGEPEERPSAAETADALALWIDAAVEQGSTILVIPRLDEYGPADGYVLELLLRSPRLRMVATAEHLAGPAGRIARNPGVETLSYGTLLLEEAEVFLEQTLRAESIERASLQRWYEATRGNTFALGLLAFELLQSGALRRGHGAVWGVPELEPAPREFATHVYDDRSERWRRTVEIIALAEPVFEPALLEMLDPESLAEMTLRGMVVTRALPGGETALELSHRIVAAAVHGRISPTLRLDRFREISRALNGSGGRRTLTLEPRRLLRSVTFALHAGDDVTIDELWAARELGPRLVSPRLLLGIDLAIGGHPEAGTFQRSVGLLQAVRLARLLGDEAAASSAGRLLDAVAGQHEEVGALPLALKAGLHTEALAARAVGTGWNSQLDAEYDAVEGFLAEEEAQAHDRGIALAMLRSSRALVLASLGRLRQAAAFVPRGDISDDLRLEWAHLPGRTVRMLILEQRGKIGAHRREVERLRWLATLGERPSAQLHELQGFCWFLGYWMSGSWVTAEEIVAEFEPDDEGSWSHTSRHSELGVLSTVLFAVQEGRWRDAAQLAEGLLDGLHQNDPHGLRPLGEAVLGLVLGALGEDAAAMRAAAASEVPAPGVSQMLIGLRRMLRLRALQWADPAEALSAARECAEWAASERLELIELHALHVWAMQEPEHAETLRDRALQLGVVTESPVAELLTEHISGIAAGESPYGGPGARALADVGIWLPLPVGAPLTAREREVALLAALGYSSRWISARLHLSVRTVETHLGHIFGKLGVADRDGLREWFARDRGIRRLDVGVV